MSERFSIQMTLEHFKSCLVWNMSSCLCLAAVFWLFHFSNKWKK